MGGGLKVTLQFVRVEGESLEIEAKRAHLVVQLTGPRCLYIVFMYLSGIRGPASVCQIPLISKYLYVNLF